MQQCNLYEILSTAQLWCSILRSKTVELKEKALIPRLICIRELSQQTLLDSGPMDHHIRHFSLVRFLRRARWTGETGQCNPLKTSSIEIQALPCSSLLPLSSYLSKVTSTTTSQVDSTSGPCPSISIFSFLVNRRNRIPFRITTLGSGYMVMRENSP